MWIDKDGNVQGHSGAAFSTPDGRGMSGAMKEGETKYHNELMDSFKASKTPQDCTKNGIAAHLNNTASGDDIRTKATVTKDTFMTTGGLNEEGKPVRHNLRKEEDRENYARVVDRSRYAQFEAYKALGGDVSKIKDPPKLPEGDFYKSRVDNYFKGNERATDSRENLRFCSEMMTEMPPFAKEKIPQFRPNRRFG